MMTSWTWYLHHAGEHADAVRQEPIARRIATASGHSDANTRPEEAELFSVCVLFPRGGG